ncbi:hypothetical protein OH77DRAFT_339530 [Trametes cingulata]|nr:hypothetical protein OH77DRAFT_339530 [Trametes cingulata]
MNTHMRASLLPPLLFLDLVLCHSTTLCAPGSERARPRGGSSGVKPCARSVCVSRSGPVRFLLSYFNVCSSYCLELGTWGDLIPVS